VSLSLSERVGVVATPNAVFHDHKAAGAPYVRFAYCKQEAVLSEAASRLGKLGDSGSV
jgi:N-succinyldiaminopimelate aminotransferase